MAGIAGICFADDIYLEGMLNRIHHRGTHETWMWHGGNISLGCCELYPAALPKVRSYASTNDKAVVLDGHIYDKENPELADAHIILHFYEKFGSRFAERLDGDFACAIADGQELILARDSVGLKPLYYGYRDGNLCFASEAKGLLDVANEIKEFPPSYIYTTTDGFRRYTPRAKTLPDFDTPEQAAKILTQLLEEAVQLRIKDNAPGGILLSGGLDSSIIACLAKEYKPDIIALTVGMEDADDLSPARDMAHYLGIEHHEYIYTKEEIAQVLPQVIYHLESFEEDCVPGAVANFFASRLVSNYTNCVLSGEGADEFLGGYHELKSAKDEEELSKLMEQLITIAYNTGLQRLDRAMAVHSVEFRTPFLDQKVTEFCRKLPVEWKIHGPEKVEKWILRKAFSHRLPEDIVWRVKCPFGAGTGSFTVLRSIAQNHISKEEFEACRHTEEGLTLHSREELYYYRIFKEKFPHPSFPFLVAKWDPFKPDFQTR